MPLINVVCSKLPFLINAGQKATKFRVLWNMVIEGDNLLAYTRKWFTQVNRGGLFSLNNLFSMFVEIEKNVRNQITVYDT